MKFECKNTTNSITKPRRDCQASIYLTPRPRICSFARRPVPGLQVWRLQEPCPARQVKAAMQQLRQAKAALQQGKTQPSKASRNSARLAEDTRALWMQVQLLICCCFCGGFDRGIYTRRVARFAVSLLACRSPPVAFFDRHQHRHQRVSREEASGL